MHYHIILTKECNLHCNYCGGGSDSPPREIQYQICDLEKFLSRDKAPVIAFYGGEPLLRIETMKRIMDSVQGRFVIQTNGVLLDKIEPRYLEKIHSILVSIDGTKEVTDRERGTGTYDRIMQNLKLIRYQGFCGDLVARMTVVLGMDIYENVLHILKLTNPGFDHVHWQLSFGMFWENWENSESVLSEWISTYNSSTSSLIEWWVGEMALKGRVHGIVPFIGVTNSLLGNSPSRLRCGSGIDFFTILPDGRISVCPVSIDFDFSVIGSIYNDIPVSLCDKATIGEPCLSCNIFRICGGRCLFVNHAQDMLGENGYALICSTVKHLVRELQEALPYVRELITRGVVKRQDFEYPELNNGCEIIP
jgi:uncharacterized protein